ncbi:hypothetical protein [Dokdonella sp.]|uniref:hypothetical protein n=1 Tax=Dokdonella sp. TaxID=2291710 RepID=UPI003C621EEC
MSVRKSTFRKSTTTLITAALLAALSFGANAQSTARLSDSAPYQATLMPTLAVTANASDPSAPQRWSLSNAKPVKVTLLPAMTIGVEAGSLAVTRLPTVTVLAEIEPERPASSIFASIGTPPANASYLLAD